MHERIWMRFPNFRSDNLKSKIKNPKWMGLSVIAFVLVVAGAVAQAEQPKKVARICYLGNTVSNSETYMKPFRERIREMAYIEGQNITIDYRYWEGKVERLPVLAAEFVSLNCDVILTSGSEAAEAAKKATKTIPVVMAFGADAVRRGIVADLARPGGNITGLTSFNVETLGKRLELLKETVPKLARVAFLWSLTSLDAEDEFKEVEAVGRFLRLGLQSLTVKGSDDFEGVFEAASKKRAQALLLGTGGFFGAHQKRIVDLAAKSRLPGIYPNVQYVEAGGLMTYSEDRSEMFRRAAEIVDKILKGTKPADIPVERPKKFDFVINLKAAKHIGLTVPPEVLARANRIIR